MAATAHEQGAVLLDLDGTLIDSLPDTASALNRLRGELGRPPIPNSRVGAMVGDGVAKLVERGLSLPGESAPNPIEQESHRRRYLDLYTSQMTAETQLYDGVRETLMALRHAGWRLAICTNKPEAASREILRVFDLAQLFDTIAGGDSFPERKPDGRHLLATLQRMRHVSGPAIMVGDASTDLIAGRSAGLPVVLASYGYGRTPVRELGADAVIDHFNQLPPALAGLTSRKPGSP